MQLFSWRQNELRHLALNCVFLRFTDFKGWKYSFSSPIPSMQLLPLFELPIENNKHPNFEWRGQGGVWILLFSEVTIFE